ncbi:hypothetical protein BU23DRAFT_554582 [Bimuria novae-zelandiae CBS 107.79]|uniref:Uncharacterized protein n=1 Tax=Bimuria novae-zelandiae CBS 107.79 TaxID=1447943 RepID=A0A6A5V8R1_9PLEO|nr:hypothetical protein BU23DRAFT_554582 [Bimuria novae-zelandiae CBS 107.79]
MAPFRSRDRSNRSGRGQVEHNALEGLPISQYREVEITVGPNTTENKQLDKDDWPAPPMPRDSHLLPEHSQQILARARSGRIYKPPAPPEEDKEVMDEEEEHKEVRQGFTIKKWAKVPRHLEEPEREYLAKRRKGLPSQYHLNGAMVTQPTPMRETKVKKTDAEGNVNVYKVLVPEGQAVEGEIQSTDAITDAEIPAPGTVVEGVGVVNAEGVVVASDLLQQTPPRRRPPPPKKKKKSGPGRGKKKVLFVEGATEQGTPISSTGSELLTVPGLKQEGSAEPSEGGDTPMPDAADDDEVSGEEGSEDEDHEDQETAAHAPTPTRSVQVPAPAPAASAEVTDGFSTESAKTSIADATQTTEHAPSAVIETSVANRNLASEVDVTAAEDDATLQAPAQQQTEEVAHRDTFSSPELPLSTVTHSRQNSLNQASPILPSLPAAPEAPIVGEISPPGAADQRTPSTTNTQDLPQVPTDSHGSEGEPDLLGSLERQLEQDRGSMDAS